MDEPWEHYAKWNHLVTERQRVPDSITVKYLTESRSGMVVAGLGGRENGELLNNGHKLSGKLDD